MPVEETKVVSRSSVSSRIIAAGIVIAFCYWASTILVTLLVAVLLAYFLDPVVTWMEQIRIPRALGSLLIVLLTAVILATIGYSLIDRADQFSADWPKYRVPLQRAASQIDAKMESVERNVSDLGPDQKTPGQVVAVGETHTIRNMLVGRLNSLYEFVLAATFVPFLLFFMLAAKRQVWHATMQLFAPGERTAVRDALSEVTLVLRSYLMGTALVGVVLVAASTVFFWMMGLDFPFLTGLVSGICNLVPYLGVIMSWVPPLLVGLKKYNTVTPFLVIFTGLTVLHIVTANLLIPALVGWRVRLNALALTIALLFWGWLWGGMGLILAIPITAVLKVVCDHVESLQPVGRWLSA
jgi:predicted PurR-regulated permease PerM